MALNKLKESAFSVLPITVVVVILSFTLAPQSLSSVGAFLIGSLLVIGGMTLFSLGADLAMIPIGEMVGSTTTKSRNLFVILAITLLIGIIITIAEPDLSVLASSLSPAVNKWLLILLVALGVGIFLTLSMLRVIFGVSLRLLLAVSYGVVFLLGLVLTLLGKSSFLPLSLDSGGVTTGPMTVPFIIAMGVGVANIGGKGTDETFGFVALASVGPILTVLLFGIFSDVSHLTVTTTAASDSFLGGYLSALLLALKETAIAIGPIVVFFLIYKFAAYRTMPLSAFRRIVFGLFYTYLGLVLFMTGARAGFAPLGDAIGRALALKNPYVLLVLGFALGFMIVAAEPAVHVLNTQIEKISGGTIKRGHVLLTMMVGVALSVGLSMLRVLLRFSLWWLILPGYVLAIGLSFITPRTYTAIAFDSGGVASGPMTATFLLPLAVGACTAVNGAEDVVGYAYGLVAMVAMTPLIVLQLLGLVVAFRTKKAEKALPVTPKVSPADMNAAVEVTDMETIAPSAEVPLDVDVIELE